MAQLTRPKSSAERDRDAMQWTLDRIEALGRAGFIVSICCGPSGGALFRWSVNVLSPQGWEFAQPYAADSFANAVEIAEKEIQRRGWSMP